MNNAFDIPGHSIESVKILEHILTSPKRLNGFEKYLKRDAHHNHLIFIEEVRQLHYENDVDKITRDVQQIYHTFVEDGAPWFVQLQSQDVIRQRLELSEWQQFSVKQFANIFTEAESEVIEFLASQLSDFRESRDSPRNSRLPIPSDTDGARKRVVIVGGGFTGCTVASILDPMTRFEVVLIDNKDSFEYTPSLIKNLVCPKEFPTAIRIPHNSYVKNGRVIIGHAHGISRSARHITINDTEISFDYLVIATGSTYTSQFKSSDTSTWYRTSQIDHQTEELTKSKSILIIGGGLVGCELASEVSRTFDGTRYPKKRITVVESNPTLVPRSTPRQQEKALAYLTKLGVEVVLKEPVVKFESFEENQNFYIGTKGRRYVGYDKVFLATGTKPASEILYEDTDDFANCIDCRGCICVKPTLQVDHWLYQHVFAGGDVTNIREEKTGYAATLAGVVIARNICRMEKGKLPINQSEKGTIAPPQQPLHGVSKHGGVGKESLNVFKKSFSFISSQWAALKQFDEHQFLKLVSGESHMAASVIGRFPKKLMLEKEPCKNKEPCDNRMSTQVDFHSTYPNPQTQFHSFAHSTDTLTSSFTGALSVSDTIV